MWWYITTMANGVGGKSEETDHLLVVVVDISEAFSMSLAAENPSQRLSIHQCLDSVVTFCNSYLLLDHCHSIAVYIAHQAGSQMVYPAPLQKELSLDDPRLQTGKYEPLVHMNELLNSEIQRVMERLTVAPPHLVSNSSLLSGALSKCLCYIQRCNRETPVGKELSSRIIVISSMSDDAVQYVSIMNCIFAAQKNSVPIDSCVLWQDSSFLQQASDITSGVYVKVPEPAGLLHYLLWVFLPNGTTRDQLSLPLSMEIDYRASCFCHQRLVDVGFICSVCLSIFCQFAPICSTCQTHFKLPDLLAGKMEKPDRSDKLKRKKNHKHSKSSQKSSKTQHDS